MSKTEPTPLTSYEKMENLIKNDPVMYASWQVANYRAKNHTEAVQELVLIMYEQSKRVEEKYNG